MSRVEVFGSASTLFLTAEMLLLIRTIDDLVLKRLFQIWLFQILILAWRYLLSICSYYTIYKVQFSYWLFRTDWMAALVAVASEKFLSKYIQLHCSDSKDDRQQFLFIRFTEV